MRELTMNAKYSYRSFLNRRNFILSLLMSPFLLDFLISDDRGEKIKMFPSNKDGDLIILGGWVMLSDDLNADSD